jgi:ribosome-binding factor A
MPVSIRTERITEQLRNELSVILRDDVTDPRIGMLSIIRIKLSRDLSHAQVFWSPVSLDDVDLDDMEAGLASAAPYVRRLVAERLNLRRTPAFDFRYDPSIEEGDRTLTLLKQLDITPEADAAPGADEHAAPAQEAAAATGEDEDGATT